VGFGGIWTRFEKCCLWLPNRDKLLVGQQTGGYFSMGRLLKDVLVRLFAVIAGFPSQRKNRFHCPTSFFLIHPYERSVVGLLVMLTLDAQFPHAYRYSSLLRTLWDDNQWRRCASHCEVAELFARALGFAEHVQQTLRFQWGCWMAAVWPTDLAGAEIPMLLAFPSRPGAGVDLLFWRCNEAQAMLRSNVANVLIRS